MTVAEDRFLTGVPRKLDAIENHLEKMASCLERLTEVVINLYSKEE